MGSWGKLILEMLVFAIVILVVYNALKYYLFNKIKVNKWIILVAAFVVLLVPNFLGANQKNPFWVYGPSGLFILLFLWFVDLNGWNRGNAKKSGTTSTTSFGKKSNKKDVIIRPKAKPNRVKKKED